MIAIESNGLTIALARKEDVIQCHDEDTATALRAKGYVPLWSGSTSRPATPEEQVAYNAWQAGRAC
jgi:hypothetical protein